MRFWERGLPERVVGYRAMLRTWDSTLERLHDGLERRGYDESNTVFVVVADHGEGLSWPWHHGQGHGNFLYPSAVHVPWIVRGPGVARGHEVSGLSGQIDVLPTVLGLLGLPDEAEGDGLDLSAQLTGDEARVDRKRIFVDTWFRHSSRAAVYTEDRFCQMDFDPASTERHLKKFEARKSKKVPHFVDGCCDYADDPECGELTRSDPALLSALGPWRQLREIEARAFGSGDEAEVDEATQEQLRELGYLDD